MPIQLVPLITAIAGITASAIQSSKNRKSQEQTNREARQFALETMQQQRQWALQDFDTQNKYNSPIEQMNRLRQAGLNPNLVYGRGADNTADSIRSVQNQGYSPIAPKHDWSGVNSTIQNFQNMRSAEKQIENMKATNGLIKAQEVKTLAEAADKSYDLEFKKMVEKANEDKIRADSWKSEVESVEAYNRSRGSMRNEAAKTLALELNNVNTALQRQKLEAEIAYINSGTALRDAEAKLTAIGINRNDPIYMRMLGQIMSEYVQQAIQNVQNQNK